jgi:hypothetical protein
MNSQIKVGLELVLLTSNYLESYEGATVKLLRRASQLRQ